MRTSSARSLACASSDLHMRCSQSKQTSASPIQSPQLMNLRYLDLPLLISWLSARQYAPEGGFSGRTNKLVDGCYSHWVGGCWPLIQAALNGPQSKHLPDKPYVGNFYSEEGLIRYIVSCCQAREGGLRDKPNVYVNIHSKQRGLLTN